MKKPIYLLILLAITNKAFPVINTLNPSSSQVESSEEESKEEESKNVTIDIRREGTIEKRGYKPPFSSQQQAYISKEALGAQEGGWPKPSFSSQHPAIKKKIQEYMKKVALDAQEGGWPRENKKDTFISIVAPSSQNGVEFEHNFKVILKHAKRSFLVILVNEWRKKILQNENEEDVLMITDDNDLCFFATHVTATNTPIEPKIYTFDERQVRVDQATIQDINEKGYKINIPSNKNKDQLIFFHEFLKDKEWKNFASEGIILTYGNCDNSKRKQTSYSRNESGGIGLRKLDLTSGSPANKATTGYETSIESSF